MYRDTSSVDCAPRELTHKHKPHLLLLLVLWYKKKFRLLLVCVETQFLDL